MWLDPALDYAWMDPCKFNLSLNSILLEKLWTPNSCFINSKTADIHRSPFPNIFLLIYANGSGKYLSFKLYILVWTNYRLKLQGPCEMDLTRYFILRVFSKKVKEILFNHYNKCQFYII